MPVAVKYNTRRAVQGSDLYTSMSSLFSGLVHAEPGGLAERLALRAAKLQAWLGLGLGSAGQAQAQAQAQAQGLGQA
jgi:hypothetical protein